MAQGEFTKEEGEKTINKINDMFEGISIARRGDYIGHLNDILLFTKAAIRNAPK